jgi:hypothetical protein
MHPTQGVAPCKTVTPHKIVRGKRITPTVTVKTPTAHPSLRLDDLRADGYRIAGDRTADLRVPGLDFPIVIEEILLLIDDQIEHAVEIRFLGRTVILGPDPLVINSSPGVSVVISQ